METIIRQIISGLVENILKKIKITAFNLNELGNLLLQDCKGATVQILEAYIQEMNAQIRADKESRKGRLTLKEKDRPRTVLTEVGPLEYRRDCYYDKEDGHYVTPLDQMLGVGKYERISGAVAAALVEKATEYSYAASARDAAGGAVSRQTVRNQILRIHVPEKEPEAVGRKVEALHVFADEDHAHLQKADKKKGKESQMVPLVVVTEGINSEDKRHKTANPMAFVDEEFDTKRLWDSVSGYIAKAYDVDSIETICVHADGGGWIKKGLEEYRQTVHVMDGYHFERALKSVSAGFQGRNIRSRMHRAIDQADRKGADRLLQEMMELSEDEKARERVKEFGTYLFDHWDEILNRRNGEYPGSCTEGQVSHLLSKRFSREPMGWSRSVLGKLSVARIYVRNGGKLSWRDIEEPNKEKELYREYAARIVDEAGKGISDWSIFEQREPMIFDTASGTQQALHKIGMCRNLLS